jgi:hypothetical protein
VRASRLKRRVDELIGCEVMMEVINDCREVLADWEDSTTAHGEYNNETVEEACACCDESNEASSEPISRRWIRVHHITNNV